MKRRCSSPHLFQRFSLSNGITFDEDRGIIYFIDSARGDILPWDYNSEDAKLSNERSVFSLELQNLPFNLTGKKFIDKKYSTRKQS